MAKKRQSLTLDLGRLVEIEGDEGDSQIWDGAFTFVIGGDDRRGDEAPLARMQGGGSAFSYACVCS